jgi:hypothetical protein
MDPVLLLVPIHIRDSPTAIRRFESLRFDSSKPIVFGKVDVTDLYNSLNLELVSRALEHYLKLHFDLLKQNKVDPGPWSIQLILRLLDLANRSNYVEYAGNWYAQLKGIAMGRAAGVTIAVLTLGYIEINLQNHFFNDPSWLFLGRYIDDIMFVRDSDLQRTGSDVARAYKLELSIDTTMEACVVSMDGSIHKSIDVLDFTVTRTGDHFEVSPYDKPTNLHLFIPPRSNHPSHVGYGWVRAYLQRLARNSSTFETFADSAENFFEHLRARGFNRKTLLSYFDDFSYSHERTAFWTSFNLKQLSYNQRVTPKAFVPATHFYAIVPYNKATGSIHWTRLFNSIRARHMDDLIHVQSNYPSFRTAWTSLPSLATLVVTTLQSHLQGNPNPNPND